LRDNLAFDPSVRLKPTRKHIPLDSELRNAAWSASGDANAGPSKDFPSSNRSKPWLEYESMRGKAYPAAGDRSSGRTHKGPRWQDLTHGETQRLQEMCLRKRMLDRKMLFVKTQHMPNPEKDAKLAMRKKKRTEESQEQDGHAMYPAPFLDVHPESETLQRMVDGAQLDELESRFRSRIRQQKLENAKLQKTAVPNVGGTTLDPIRRHVERRLVRQRVKIHAGIEDALTRNTAQVLYEFLRGVSISVVRVTAERPRQTQNIHYHLTSDHDPAWVQRQLQILAPKIRSDLALRVNMGQTPNIRFVPEAPAPETKRSSYVGFAMAMKKLVPVGGSARPR